MKNRELGTIFPSTGVWIVSIIYSSSCYPYIIGRKEIAAASLNKFCKLNHYHFPTHLPSAVTLSSRAVKRFYAMMNYTLNRHPKGSV
jgi:hypothetical protein